MKKQDLKVVYELLNSAKLTKMEDKDKFAIIKIMRELKPIDNEIKDAVKDAQDKLKADNHDELIEKAQGGKMTNEEVAKFNAYYKKFNDDVYAAVKDLLETDVELKEHISEEAFEKFMASNDFTVEQIVKLDDVIVAQ